jgi:hypothetical protein
VEVFDERSGNLIEVLARLHDLERLEPHINVKSVGGNTQPS